MRARVDEARCEAFGTCAALAPDVFLLDEWGYATAADDGAVPEGSEEAARRAAFQCPMNAISVEE